MGWRRGVGGGWGERERERQAGGRVSRDSVLAPTFMPPPQLALQLKASIRASSIHWLASSTRPSRLAVAFCKDSTSRNFITALERGGGGGQEEGRGGGGRLRVRGRPWSILCGSTLGQLRLLSACFTTHPTTGKVSRLILGSIVDSRKVESGRCAEGIIMGWGGGGS